ncbi:tRNA pseudouridine(38-40) synthase TruA [Clostridiaceae bacterium 35-E11]
MKNVKLTIEYDGTQFSGWQKQHNARTIQEEVEKALVKLMKKEVKINGSGRTDAGVHALKQVANFCEQFTIPIEKLPVALNGLLPCDISIQEAIEVEKDFHARYAAKGKKYIYKIYNAPLRSALLQHYAYFVPQTLKIEEMKKAAQHFIGQHNFKGFMASGSSVQDTVRNIHALEISCQEKLILIEVKGNGFLYNMVRIMAGTLVDVGKGKFSADEIPEIILSEERKKAGHTAPPQGLYLAEVYY